MGVHDNFFSTLSSMAVSSKVEELVLRNMYCSSYQFTRFMSSFTSLWSLQLHKFVLGLSMDNSPDSVSEGHRRQTTWSDQSCYSLDNLSTVRYTNLTEITVDDWTLLRCETGRAKRLFPHVHTANLRLTGALNDRTIRNLQLQRSTAIHIARSPEVARRVPFLIEPEELSRILAESFPKLARVTFTDLGLSNEEAESLIRAFCKHQQMEIIRMTRCDTDSRLDPLILDLNVEGRVRIEVLHGCSIEDNRASTKSGDYADSEEEDVERDDDEDNDDDHDDDATLEGATKILSIHSRGYKPSPVLRRKTSNLGEG